MARIQNWTVEIDGQQYVISYKPNIWTNKIQLKVNEEELPINFGSLQALAGIDVPFIIAGKELRFVRIGQKVKIAMDGHYLDSDKEYKPIEKVPWWGWVLAGLSFLVVIIAGGGALPYLIGFSFGILCLRVSVKSHLSVIVRILLCLGFVFLSWLFLILLSFGVSYLLSY